LLVGCGDDGDDGKDGAPGKDGKDAPVKTVESCNVCHGDGKTASVDTAHNLVKFGDVVVSNIVSTVSGADRVVTFNVKVNGANAANGYYDTVYTGRAYYLQSNNNYNVANANAPVSLGNGNYSITLPGSGAITDARFLIFIQNLHAHEANPKPVGADVSVLFDVGTPPVGADVIGDAGQQVCASCHGSSGYFSKYPTRLASTIVYHNSFPSYGGKACRVCHGAANSGHGKFRT